MRRGKMKIHGSKFVHSLALPSLLLCLLFASGEGMKDPSHLWQFGTLACGLLCLAQYLPQRVASRLAFFLLGCGTIPLMLMVAFPYGEGLAIVFIFGAASAIHLFGAGLFSLGPAILLSFWTGLFVANLTLLAGTAMPDYTITTRSGSRIQFSSSSGHAANSYPDPNRPLSGKASHQRGISMVPSLWQPQPSGQVSEILDLGDKPAGFCSEAAEQCD